MTTSETPDRTPRGPRASRPLPWADTHPFISFRFDAGRLGPECWVLLGECSSKIQHISGVPLKPHVAESLSRIYLTKGAHATTAIEGNTLSEEQVRRRLEGRLDLPKSQEYMGREVDNVVRGYNYVSEQCALGQNAHITADELKTLNHMVLDGLELDPGVVPGRYREHTVGVGDYLSLSAAHTDELVERLCAWLNGDEWDHRFGSDHVLPILKAIVAHLYLAWIHPFGDGNGRTARLLEFDILTRAGVPAISAHLLSDHYNRTRAAYYRALSAARRDPGEFVRYAVQGFVDGLREQLVDVRDQQTEVAWVNYVYESFADAPRGDTADRRREVALVLGRVPEPVTLAEIPTLSRKLTALYRDRSDRTLDRDVQHLAERGLVIATEGGLMANLDAVLAFRPLARKARKRSAPRRDLRE